MPKPIAVAVLHLVYSQPEQRLRNENFTKTKIHNNINK